MPAQLESRRQLPLESLRHRLGLGGVFEVVEQDGELVAAEPRHGVAGAHRRPQPARDPDEELVAGYVAEAVVDDLEAVEVEEEHGEPISRVPLGAAAGELQVIHKQGAVCQSRQPVVEGVVEQLLFDLLALGYLLQKLPVARRELDGALGHALFQALVEPFTFRRPLGDVPHLAHAAPDGDEQESVFEEDPARVFEPAPVTNREHAVDRLGPEHPAQEVVRGHDDG